MSYESILESMCDRDPNIVVMTAENRAVIRNLPSKLGARFIDVGIAEMTQVGMAAGLALRGRKPITHALATFLTLRAFEFIRTDVGIPSLPVKFVGGVAGFLSEANGPTHQALEDIALMRGIPNMRVFCPADEQELLEALPTFVDCSTPAYMRFNASAPAVDHTTPFEWGRAEVLAEEGEVAILTYGFLLAQAEDARKRLEERGIATRLVNMRTLAPVDKDAILDSARRSRLLLTFEDHFEQGGLYSIVAQTLFENRQTTRVVPMGLSERWFKPLKLPGLLAHEGFTGEALAARIEQEVR